MAGMSATRFGGVALIVGAALGLFATLIRPGSTLVDPLGPGSTMLQRVRTLSENPELTHIASLLGALGLFLVLHGFFTIRRALGDKTAADASIRFGILLLTFGTFGIATSNGLNHMIVHVINHGADRGVSLPTLFGIAVDIQAVKAGILIISGYALLLGYAAIGCGLYRRFPSGIHRALAAVMSAVAVAALIVLGIGDHFHDLDAFYRVATLAVIPLDIWALTIGVALYQEHPSLTSANAE